ncbi:glycosyltransferase family 2 protein [Candidatus Pacearchaeota archaeon]|nr:glycosyltransferase family 2 protein [Candidatus Pacearchaeota archaeon]
MISLILCAHNEEAMIGKVIDRLKTELLNLSEEYEFFLCLSDCTDNTEKIVRGKIKRDKIKIKVLKTPRGKINSQIEALKKINKRSWAQIFLDGDIGIRKGAMLNLIHDAKKYSKVKMFYSNQIPVKNKSIFYNIINVRTINPVYVIAKVDVREFHPYSRNKQKKVFSTGGIYLLRKGVYDIDARTTGDDSYLTHSIYYRFGPGTIKEVRNSQFIYQPVKTFSSWINKWKRIWGDINNLYFLHPEFKYLERYMELRIDYKKLIKEKQVTLLFFFSLERMWNFFGRKVFKLVLRNNSPHMWKPLEDTKEVKIT